MSVTIPNMNLPKGCGDCPFSKGINFKEMRCLAETTLYISDGSEYKRDSKCPLKECNNAEPPEWLYHTPFEGRSWVDFLAETTLYISDGSEYKRDSKCPLKECNNAEPPEWLYHTPFEGRSWVDFNAVEKALGFRLFGWQKEYILTGCAYAARRTGKTTAMILYELLDIDGKPIDFTKPAPSRRIDVIRCYYRDIWEKLRDAGIEMRPVFWSIEDKRNMRKNM